MITTPFNGPTFHEDGMICVVDVLEDNSDKQWYRYKLKVKAVIQESSFLKPPKVGEIFSVDQIREGGFNGMWHLLGYESKV